MKYAAILVPKCTVLKRVRTAFLKNHWNSKWFIARVGFKLWSAKNGLSVTQKSNFLSREPDLRISWKFIHSSFIPQLRTYYIFEKILAVNLWKYHLIKKMCVFTVFFTLCQIKKVWQPKFLSYKYMLLF